MGYTTDFEGQFALDKQLNKNHQEYLQAFAQSRRMKRDSNKTEKLPDDIRKNVDLPCGIFGEFYVGGYGNNYGQKETSDILDYNQPPDGQPGLWCQWIPSEDGMSIIWDDGEKFYNYVEWIKYIIHNFLQPWGYTLNGEVNWYGEDREDIGKIVIKKNKVTIKEQ